jgi:hypothetical protein
MNAEQAMPRKPRYWLVHTFWAAVATLLFIGGILLGMRWCGAALGTTDMTNHRQESFGRMRIALNALEQDDPAELRKGTTKLLYNAMYSLAGVPRFADCKTAERDMIERAKARLDVEMPPQSEGETLVRDMAYKFCDKAPTEVNYP